MVIGTRILLAKTCLMCCKLKQACEFGWVVVSGKRYRNSYCQDCKNVRGRPVMKRHQERATTVAVRNREPWTAHDLDRLVEMAQRGLTGPQMALALNRTVYAVYTMKNKIFKEN